MGDKYQNVWGAISEGFSAGQELIESDGSWVSIGAAYVYGVFILVSFFILYLVYCAVYLGALVPFLILKTIGGVVLMLAALPMFRGAAKSYAQALFKYTLICVFSSFIINAGLSVMQSSVKAELITQDGMNTQSFFIIIFTAWITLLMIPKSAEVVSDLVGGSASDVAGDIRNTLKPLDRLKKDKK